MAAVGVAAVSGAAGAAVAGVVAPASSAAAKATVPTCRNTLVVLVRGVRAAIGEVVMAITFADPPDTDRSPP
ncbi:hypothetical protein GCM10010492_24440 [Saccharothrix mutabilis subsp. mutabilis]|uniref:Secreted protein n=1 Tax=Saccharothrix mutabilis subsp. mutabilis TaxID=66855 RepID=A0ABN0TMD2_9PSEU